MRRNCTYLLIVILGFISCNSNETITTPKPRLYPKVEYPDVNKEKFSEGYCNLSFEYPDYFTISQDKYFFEGKPLDPCWFDMESKVLNCSVHCSYLPIKDKKHFQELVEDAFELAAKHNTKANYRNESIIDNSSENVYGLIFELSGPVASPFQFYVTDSLQHFMRGSIYFNAKVNSDSIAPVYQFVKKDLNHMIETFRWE